MPNHKSAKRRVVTNEKARLHNRHYRTMMRSAIKKLRSAPDKESADTLYRSATSLLDRLVNKGIIHRNQAANNKSKLSKVVHALS